MGSRSARGRRAIVFAVLTAWTVWHATAAAEAQDKTTVVGPPPKGGVPGVGGGKAKVRGGSGGGKAKAGDAKAKAGSGGGGSGSLMKAGGPASGPVPLIPGGEC